jgi:hypothetical protein
VNSRCRLGLAPVSATQSIAGGRVVLVTGGTGGSQLGQSLRYNASSLPMTLFLSEVRLCRARIFV